MSSSEYAVFALSFAASAAAPGPEIAAVIGRTLARGLRACVVLAAGIVLGKLLMLTVAVIGLAALVATLGPVFVVLQLAGAAYLLFLGVRKWRSARDTVRQPREVDDGWTQILLGLGMTLSNPIAVAFYMALLPGVVDVADITVGRYLVLAGILVLVMVAVVLGYGLAAETARKLVAGGAGKAWIDRTAGMLFIAAGAWVALRPIL